MHPIDTKRCELHVTSPCHRSDLIQILEWVNETLSMEYDDILRHPSKTKVYAMLATWRPPQSSLSKSADYKNRSNVRLNRNKVDHYHWPGRLTLSDIGDFSL